MVISRRTLCPMVSGLGLRQDYNDLQQQMKKIRRFPWIFTVTGCKF
jgi:hypothetical protein